mmetsp:Transcript_26122/g.75406  ORF Transcript_26122/g.75406 Transcript_26122/m.75406 type:complete len:396 (+) Transcript_26122:659-1846(+)
MPGEVIFDGVDHRAAHGLHLMQSVEVLILHGVPVAEVPRAVDHASLGEAQGGEAIAGGVLIPREAEERRRAEGGAEALEVAVLEVGVVAEPHDDRRWTVRLACLEDNREGRVPALRRHAGIGEQPIQPIRLQLGDVGIGLRLRLPGGAPAAALRACPATTAAGSVGHLFLEGREDEHDLGAVRGISSARESVGNGVFADLVQHRVERELVGADQLRDVLHDGHHLVRIRGQGMHPAAQAEAKQGSTPSGKKHRIDVNGLRDAEAVDDALRVRLVARAQAVHQLLGRVAGGDSVEAELGQHALVPVAPLQQGHRIGEDVLRPHGHEPLADALVVLAHGRRRYGLGVGLLPRALAPVLALDPILRRPGEVQDAKGLKAEELAELQERSAGRRRVRRV